MQELQDKVALITGGGTGIGRATAILLAKQGMRIIVNYSRSEADAEQTVADIRQLGINAITVKANVADEGDVQQMLEIAEGEFGRLDVLVNNAGTTHFVPYADLDNMTPKLWHEIYDVNVVGAFLCSRFAIRLMKCNEGGVVINVASIAGITGKGSSIAYAASKAAMINMTKALAASQAPEVRVNAVAPGVVDTRWVKGKEFHTDPQLKATPLQRIATGDDVAQAIYGLIISEFVTGETIVVDGGRLLN